MRLAQFEALSEHAQDVWLAQEATYQEVDTRLRLAAYLAGQGCDYDGAAWYEQVTRPLRRCLYLLSEWDDPLFTLAKRHPWGPRPHVPAEQRAWRQACRSQVYTAQQQRRQTTRERIDAYKRANRVEDVIGRATDLRGHGARLTGRCPIHQDRTSSLVVYVEQQSWHCYGACATGGDVLDWLKLTNEPAYQAVVRGA